ncbi:MAG: hypothetical protein ACI4VX_01305 [Succinivibrionaceae bacterium]
MIAGSYATLHNSDQKLTGSELSRLRMYRPETSPTISPVVSRFM